jgi:hypothetical protein
MCCFSLETYLLNLTRILLVLRPRHEIEMYYENLIEVTPQQVEAIQRGEELEAVSMCFALPATNRNSVHLIDTTGGAIAKIMDAVVVEMNRGNRGMSATLGLEKSISFTANVESAGIYTIVIAETAKDLQAAIDNDERIPANRRAKISRKLIKQYSELYPKWVYIACLFSRLEVAASEGGKADPIGLSYETTYDFQDRAYIPGLDDHDGFGPAIGDVDVNHVLMVGGYGVDGRYKIEPSAIGVSTLPSGTPTPTSFDAIEERGELPNGDWYYIGKKFDRFAPPNHRALREHNVAPHGDHGYMGFPPGFDQGSLI